MSMNEFILLILSLKLTCTQEVDVPPDIVQNENSQFGVRAVVIKCQPEEGFPPDSDLLRFQREELFKHNVLQNCKQKLAVTIKMSSDPNQAFGEEYIPIDHVLGVNRKRIRLLNPYVLRLRRMAPFQAYKLRKMDMVRGVVANIVEKNIVEIGTNESRRMQRDLQSGHPKDWSNKFGFSSFKHDDGGSHSYSIKIRDLKQPLRKTTVKTKGSARISYYDHNYLCPKINDSLRHHLREKRQSTKDYEYNFATWTPTDFTKSQKLHQQYDNRRYKQPSHKDNEQQLEDILYQDTLFDALDKSDFNKDINRAEEQINSKSFNGKLSNIESPEIYKAKYNEMNTNLYKKNIQYNLQDGDKSEEKYFIIYEIGDPELWYSAQVQLFEKLSTPEGKTEWNDLMKDEIARVNYSNPEWSNQDVVIQYKPAEFIDREHFVLPMKDLCLVVPTKQDFENNSKDKFGEFMIIPVDDVITLDDTKDINKRNEHSDSNASSNEANVQEQRQVIVRAARDLRPTLMGSAAESPKIIFRGSEKYLKLPHTKPHYTQMDVEAKADVNELILVGVLGRLTTIVSDTTRRVRSILTVQATNTGLAAARMRVITRECSPELLNSNNEGDESTTEAVILPPQHTKTFRVKLPFQIPVEIANCTIALVNDKDESVAVRDVRIKRDDRCYCVWYCDCVCLGDDPKLLCRDMTTAQLLAAGLSKQQRSRHARSICYPDVVSLNMLVTVIGVILALMMLGLAKALLGLVCRSVATCGLHYFLETPRKLDHYYESSLRHRRVVYDEDGWPVHPDTKARSVGLVSEPMEFILNVIFFITLPCLVIWDAIKKIAHCQGMDVNSETNYKINDNCKKCFSSRDVQVTKPRVRRHHRGLRKWMTPQAEELTKGIWNESLAPLGNDTLICLESLLEDESGFRRPCEQSSLLDSEQDDTEYVLMQMQKSRESLARSQRQLERKTITK